MAVNQVVINGETVVDLTDTTAEADKVLDGEVFYTASGSRAVGTYVDKDTIPSAQCETAAGTAAKTATITNYTLTANTYLHFNIRYANTASSALTMNVNGKGAKPIYINGTASSSSNKTLPAGSYIAFYDGSHWLFNTDGTIPGNVLAGGRTGLNVQQAETATVTDIILSEISAIADKPYGIYTNALSWTSHLNGYSIIITKSKYSSLSIYYGFFIQNSAQGSPSETYSFFSDGTYVNLSNKASLDSPTFTGTPTAPTATAGTNNTQIATTEFVNTAIENALDTGSVSITGTGVIQAVSTTQAYMFIPYNAKDTNYSVSVTANGSIVNIGAPTSIALSTKYLNGFQVNITRSGLTNGSSYFLAGAMFTVTPS